MKIHKQQFIGTMLGKTQNKIESLNALVWHFAPKHLYCGVKINTATFNAITIFNERYSAILNIYNVLGLIIGSETKNYAFNKDAKKLSNAE